MTLKQIEAFYWAANLGSFSIAALRLHVTQSSLSKRIVEFAMALVGHIRGGLGYVVIVASVMLSALSGSAVADAAGLADKGDKVHFDSAALRKFGKRYYAKWAGLAKAKSK